MRRVARRRLPDADALAQSMDACEVDDAFGQGKSQGQLRDSWNPERRPCRVDPVWKSNFRRPSALVAPSMRLLDGVITHWLFLPVRARKPEPKVATAPAPAPGLAGCGFGERERGLLEQKKIS